jgi:hypothetical protein
MLSSICPEAERRVRVSPPAERLKFVWPGLDDTSALNSIRESGALPTPELLVDVRKAERLRSEEVELMLWTCRDKTFVPTRSSDLCGVMSWRGRLIPR